MRSLFFIAFIVISTSAFGQFKIIKNMLAPNVPDLGSISNDNAQWVKFKDKVYFIANCENIYGSEICMTDGTPAGTEMLIDLAPGWESSNVRNMTPADDKLFFTAGSNANGSNLYVTDGTAAGTKQIKNAVVAQQLTSPQIPYMVSHKGTLYFTGYDAAHGSELWKSDGTEAGTIMVKDAIPGTQSSVPQYTGHNMCSTDDFIYFMVQGSVSVELWMTDGTDAGTKKVVGKEKAELSIGSSVLASVGNTVYFQGSNVASNYELWKTDGTSAGTMIVKDETDLDVAGRIRTWKNMVFFTRESSPSHYQLNRTDGTAAGTFALADINPNVLEGVEYNGKLYFRYFQSLWRTDGTAAGTEKVTPQSEGFDDVAGMGVINNKLFLVVEKEHEYNEAPFVLWTFDETTGLVKSDTELTFNTTFSFVDLLNVNNKIVVRNNDGIHGMEPASINEAGELTLLRNIDLLRNYQYYPTEITKVGSNLMFRLNDGVHGVELWKTDGTEEGTMLVKDINPGPEGSSLQGLASKKGLLFFEADGLWRSDGTEEGTIQLNQDDVYSLEGIVATSPVIGDFVYYVDQKQLWKTDGTPEGTTMVKELTSYITTNYASVGNNFFFIDDQWNLWKSDGTTDGTTIAFNFKTSIPGDGIIAGAVLYQANDQLFMLDRAADPRQLRLWRTDGTLNGTSVVGRFQDSGGSGKVVLGIVNNTIYYRGNETQHGFELWRSDGTTAGTYMLKDIFPGFQNSLPLPLYADGTNIYFTASIDDYTTSIWKTDGTAEGTVKIVDRGADSAIKGAMLDGMLYYVSGGTGSELWKTNGISGATGVGDIIPGLARSIYDIYVASDHLVILAQDLEYGLGLWTLDPDYVAPPEPADQQMDFPAIGTKKSNDAPFILTATASSGLAVTFEIVSGPATISGNTLTITGAGDVKVKATQAGNDDYKPVSKEQTFTVELFVGLEDEPEGINVWPNPATNTIVVNAAAYQQAIIKDLVGRNAITTNITEGATNIDVSSLPRGMYILQLKGRDSRSVTRKILLM